MATPAHHDGATRDAGEPAWPRIWAVLRILATAAIVAATVEQARLAGASAEGVGLDASFGVARLFSFFTVLSNVIAALVLLAAGVVALARPRAVDSPALAFSLASASTYMLVTGLVYNVVLRAAGGTDIMLGWSNDVHHVWAPAFLFLDVLIAPGRRALPWRSVLGVIVFPLAWVVFTLARGPFLVSPASGEPPWYPYPFLDPAQAGGYPGVALWVAGIAAVIALLAAFVVWVGRRRRCGKTPPEDDIAPTGEG